MAFDMNSIIQMGLPMISNVIWLVLGVIVVGGLGYYLLIVKKRKTWIARIWEQKADGRLQMICIDTLTEKRINKGKTLIYNLKKQKMEAVPPDWEAVQRCGGKEYVDYFRYKQNYYTPLKTEVNFNFKSLKHENKWFDKVREAVKKGRDISENSNTVYVPIKDYLVIKRKFEAMDYDLNMMMINALENREKIYADKMSWIEKYGQFITLGLLIVAIIVVVYLSYDYGATIIAEAMDKAQSTLDLASQLITKIGGTPPAS